MLHLQRAKLHTPELTFVALVVEFWVFLPPVGCLLLTTTYTWTPAYVSFIFGMWKESMQHKVNVCGFCVLICFGVLFVSFTFKCLKISQFVGFFSITLVFFSSYLSFPTLVWSCVVGFVYIARFPLL